MRIVLLRHGKPAIARAGWLTPSGFAGWIANYDAAGIDLAHPPSPETVALAKACGFAIASDLPRARESAARLGIEAELDAGFRELEMPNHRAAFPLLPLPFWLIGSRILWRLGYARHAESFAQADARAHRCAKRLADLAARYGSVVLVGHGSLNWLIARHLKRMDWRQARGTGNRYWAHRVFEDTPVKRQSARRSSTRFRR